MSLNVSIVRYRHSLEEVRSLLDTLLAAPVVSTIFVIDNSPQSDPSFESLDGIHYHFNGKNIGYGAAHNIALKKTLQSDVPYHLVLNPDVLMGDNVLPTLIAYLAQHDDVAHVMPKVCYPNGDLQYLCKLLPTPIDLLGRRFLPFRWIEKRMRRFELRDTHYEQTMEVPYLSGCFMLLRMSALRTVGLFDEQFFMYPEDIDLTRRLHRYYKTIYYPHVSIVHTHTQSSYREYKMLWVHMVNIMRYFNKWGWIFDAERKKINKNILRKLNLL